MIEPVPKIMRAAVYRGVNDLRIESIPVPKIAPASCW
jgi:L-iditol 2-dehydrogenase